MSTNWVLASGNAGKLKEFNARLSPLGIAFARQSELGVDEVPETGTTFVENAIIKARHAAEVTDRPALADDSGLCVDALGGAPGVYSARFAGDDATDSTNIDKLLALLGGETNRAAHFVSVLVLMRCHDDPLPLIVQATWDGQIIDQRRGDGGFGYDPIFYLPDLGCTAAELAPPTKNQISHRGQAINQLLDALSG